MIKKLDWICGRWILHCFFNKNRFIPLFLICVLLVSGLNSAFAAGLDKNSNKLFPIILPDIQILKKVIKNGDTISSILNPYLPLKTIYEINNQSQDIFSLAQIRKGQRYKIILRDNEFFGLEYDIDRDDRLVIQKEKDRFSINQEPIDYEVDLEVVSATINYSLFEAVRLSGEKSELGQKLSDIFAWDIDFIKDIQSGDQFKLIVEKRYREGKLFGYGKIQAAFFMNKGTVFKAFLHKNSNGTSGYYDENGNSLQKAFLKAPLAYSRISSKFTQKRLHPIFKEYRSHPGVDYAAPRGTPIKTVGDGIITTVGFQKGLGNYITIRHPNGYTTNYNHMSKFASGMKKNKRVFQGEVIGYVGKTGYATGPHLDFRMAKNGKLIDPLKYKSPSANPIKTEEMEQFLARISELSKKILMAEEIGSLDKNAT